MAKVTKWRTNNIPVAKTPDFICQKQLDLEGNIGQTA
jgi:hypothetical protein